MNVEVEVSVSHLYYIYITVKQKVVKINTLMIPPWRSGITPKVPRASVAMRRGVDGPCWHGKLMSKKIANYKRRFGCIDVYGRAQSISEQAPVRDHNCFYHLPMGFRFFLRFLVPKNQHICSSTPRFVGESEERCQVRALCRVLDLADEGEALTARNAQR